jgi:hypothetical protein
MAATKRGPKPTAEHLAALDQGRKAGRAIRTYLEMLKQGVGKKKRGRQVNWQERYDGAALLLAEDDVDVLTQLQLTQQMNDALDHLKAQELEWSADDLAAAEANFIEWAGWYSEQHGITYQTWRKMGVSAAVLRQAGVPR